jgi:polyhydroxyalkanoate synthase subunit PhaC
MDARTARTSPDEPDWAALAQRSTAAWSRFYDRCAHDAQAWTGMWAAFANGALAYTQALARDPDALARTAAGLVQGHAALWERLFAGHVPETREDRRFRDPDWQANPYFAAVLAAYQWLAGALVDLPAQLPDLSAPARRRLEFCLRQLADACAPVNFPALNPEVLRVTAERRGMNLVRGYERLLADLERGDGRIAARLCDESAFRVGGNIAATPGAVVYQNRLMQLIQYAPATAQVYRRPLLVIPPWINKYYVMDLRAQNSLVRWWAEQGHTVFMISWVNPGPAHATVTFEDYLVEGPLAALDAIAQATGERTVNTAGYCIGGTLLGCLLAHLAARGQKRIACATFFTALLDFAEPGDLGVFVNEPVLDALDTRMAATGLLDGADMALVFNLLRARELVWPALVQGYLLDRDPPAFDLLYWNGDSTRIPAPAHRWYLRTCYLENRLREPGAVTLAGTPLDLGAVAVPSYWVASAEDHIAPWRSVYASARLLGGPVRFVLAGSGHIAGVVNPPDAGKYHYDTGARLLADGDAWLGRAQREPGSWWPDWARWAARRGGGRVAAREPGTGALPAIEAAPGRYVRER